MNAREAMDAFDRENERDCAARLAHAEAQRNAARRPDGAFQMRCLRAQRGAGVFLNCRNIHVAAAAATRDRKISTSQPRRRRDPSAERSATVDRRAGASARCPSFYRRSRRTRGICRRARATRSSSGARAFRACASRGKTSGPTTRRGRRRSTSRAAASARTWYVAAASAWTRCAAAALETWTYDRRRRKLGETRSVWLTFAALDCGRRGAAAAGTWIVRGRVAAPPRLGPGYSVGGSRPSEQSLQVRGSE